MLSQCLVIICSFIPPQMYFVSVQYFAQRMDVLDTDDDGVTRQICSQMLEMVESRGQVTSQQASSSDAVRNA